MSGLGDRRRVPVTEDLDALDHDAAGREIGVLISHERICGDHVSETLQDDRREGLPAGRRRALVNDVEERSGVALAHN